MATLLDIPALQPLARLCRDYKIEFELFGGAATRVVRRTVQNTGSFGAINIFDLAGPFSDLDISHSGQPQLNTELREAILDLIPNAECFRWDLRSESEWAIYRTAAYYNNRIPVRLMSLSTNPQVGLRDLLKGADDINARKYRYERNANYPASPLYRQGQDLELFSGLLYLRALVESDLSLDEQVEQEDLRTVAKVMEHAKTVQTIVALQESAYLRSRFKYLLAGIAAHHPAKDVLNQAQIHSVIDFIKDTDPSLGFSLKEALNGPAAETAAISSARIGGDIYRTKYITGRWEVGAAASNRMTSVLTTEQPPGYTAKQSLGYNEDVILASPLIEIASGRARSNAPAGVRDQTRAIQEFMYVSLNIRNRTENGAVLCLESPYLEEDLAILMAVRPSNKGPWSIHALPGDVRLRESHTLISLNVWGLLNSCRLARILLFDCLSLDGGINERDRS